MVNCTSLSHDCRLQPALSSNWVLSFVKFQIEKDAFEEAEKIRRAREDEVIKVLRLDLLFLLNILLLIKIMICVGGKEKER